MKICALFVASMLTGCATDDGGPDVDPVAFPTGIYSLHAEAHSDTCEPARVTGDVGEVAVIVANDRISTSAPLGSAPFVTLVGYELPASTGYRSSTGAGIDPSAPCGGHSSLLLTRDLVTSGADHLVVQEMASWNISAPCTNDVVVDGLPIRTCQSDIEYTSTLVTACEAPCTIVAEASDGVHLRCKCP
jgi:hypothetical protein